MVGKIFTLDAMCLASTPCKRPANYTLGFSQQAPRLAGQKEASAHGGVSDAEVYLASLTLISFPIPSSVLSGRRCTGKRYSLRRPPLISQYPCAPAKTSAVFPRHACRRQC